ncbi:Lipopolysaccharide-assembly [Sediminibacterium ginsengisoli]|uniref:Lipopolysaccharide-assembly n=2 Tax=Sediminibacterium ginsengisoli TaxID=413434 RepID=A0A1T4RAS7_9BACT|nr:Lipopolysaccharide-assembly [Sediminibacterium ginsengisoli]
MTAMKTIRTPRFLQAICLFFFVAALSGCSIYKFNDASIPPDVKTIKVGFIENRARYVNPQVSPQLTTKLTQIITSRTKLSLTNNDDAHYVISGQITNYDGTQTVGVSGQQSTTNRLTVTVHIVLRKTLKNITDEFDVTRNFDYDGRLQFQDAEAKLLDEIIRNVSDEIFNHIFSNW